MITQLRGRSWHLLEMYNGFEMTEGVNDLTDFLLKSPSYSDPSPVVFMLHNAHSTGVRGVIAITPVLPCRARRTT